MSKKKYEYHYKYGYIYDMPDEEQREHMKLIDKYSALLGLQDLLLHFISANSLESIRIHNNKVHFNRKY